MTTPDRPLVPLAADLSGDGPLAVIIHGITENRHSFDPLLAGLDARYRVLAVDLRGHGESPAGPDDDYALDAMAADVHATVQRLAPGEAPLVIGHSLGGIVAAAYGARFPVRGVVNVDQSLALASMQDQIRSIEPMLRSEAYADVMNGMFAQMFVALPEAEQQRLTAMRRVDQPVVLGVWNPLFTLSAEELAAQVDALVTPAAPYPYLQIDGLPSGDGYAEWLGARIPGAVVEDWGLLGHYPHLVEQNRFVARVAEFDQGA